MKLWILTFLITGIIPAWGQSIYQFDVNDPSTYTTTCGKTTGAFWEVKGEDCLLTTSPAEINSTCGNSNFTNVPVDITINQSGNMECDDLAIIRYRCGNTWVNHDTIKGCNATSGQTYEYNMPCANGEDFQVGVRFINDHKTEKWRLYDGNIEINDACVLLPVDILNFQLLKEGGNHTFQVGIKSTTEVMPVLQYSRGGKHYDNIGKADRQLAQGNDFTFQWEVGHKLQTGYYRIKVGKDDEVHHSNVIRYKQDESEMLNLRLVGNKQLKVEGWNGMAKLFITTLNGNRVEERNLSLEQTDIINLPENLKGFHLATLQTASESKTVKVVLQ